MWALIQNEAVFETTNIDPAGRFHPDLKWVPCGPEVGQRWLFVDGVFRAPEVDSEGSVSDERIWRDSQVSSTEWLVMRHRDELDLDITTTLTASQFIELLNYRQKLRDWPQAGAFPNATDRPTEPAWIAEQTQ
ncbi:phage tail assembly chaperone [Pseudomonas sp.]|uniref:phage tail assembly chaperone n=1 Tax=Pseudomonas sp. TaxID=306 RepID=UPI003263804A